jgi:hypothetical protein
VAAKLWPEILLPCKHGHESPCEAGPGTKIDCRVCRRGDCPECGPEGRRVALWVSRHRPRTEREARERAAPPAPAEAPAGDPEMTGRWEHEAPWSGRLPMLPSPPDRPPDECEQCGDPLQWEPGRTVVYCPACKGLSLPTAVAGHYKRQDQRSAEVATRAAPDRRQLQAERVQIRALAQRVTDHVNEWIDEFDPDGLTGNARRLALDYRAELGAWLPEIRRAGESGDQAEVTGIMAEVKGITDRANGALVQIQHQREAIERQIEQADREAEHEAEQAELAAQAERQRAAIEAQAQRRAIEPPTRSKPVPGVVDAMGYRGGNGYVTAGVMVLSMIQKSQAEKDKQLAERGPCGFQHKKPTVPDRKYWIANLDWQGNLTEYETLNAPSVVACKKHYAVADQWIEQQAAIMSRSNARIKAVYTELT